MTPPEHQPVSREIQPPNPALPTAREQTPPDAALSLMANAASRLNDISRTNTGWDKMTSGLFSKNLTAALKYAPGKPGAFVEGIIPLNSTGTKFTLQIDPTKTDLSDPLAKSYVALSTAFQTGNAVRLGVVADQNPAFDIAVKQKVASGIEAGAQIILVKKDDAWNPRAVFGISGDVNFLSN